MLDSRFLAIVLVVSGCALTNDLIQKDHGYLCLKAKTLLVDRLYAEATEAVKLHATL
jgi:hypothetical protein